MKESLLLFLLLANSLYMTASDLYVGVAETDITPELPVALMGQFHLRIATEARTPLSASIIALETRNHKRGNDTVVFVSCDLIWISNKIWQQVRDKVKQEIPGFNVEKIILNGTHTHTGPVIEDTTDEGAYFYYDIPEKGVTRVEDYRAFLVGQISRGIIQAWEQRQTGSVTWGLRRAAVAYNRRAVYAGGEAVMYGNTASPDFESIEGYEDHDVQALFFWQAGHLAGISVNIACPSQQNEGNSTVDADFWHPVRQQLKSIYGTRLVVAGWTGAAGDQAPRPIYRQAALERMEKLSGESRMNDIASRIVAAVTKIHDVVEADKRSEVYLAHNTREIELPERKISAAEYTEANWIYKELQDQIARDPRESVHHYVKMKWNKAVADRFEEQKVNTERQLKTEIHIIRLGDIAICTNQFELFADYGIQMQSRSKALQTFVIQLAGPGTYLPTEKAIKGGGYSAVCQSNVVGHEGGQILVERTLESIEEMWTR